MPPDPRLVFGDRRLPTSFAHPHASDEARQLAQAGLILRTQVGSGVHGTAIDGQDDRDEMGICLEPPEYVTGLAGVHGEQELSSVLAQIDDAQATLTSLAESSRVADEPDRRWVNDWLHCAHLDYWSQASR